MFSHQMSFHKWLSFTIKNAKVLIMHLKAYLCTTYLPQEDILSWVCSIQGIISKILRGAFKGSYCERHVHLSFGWLSCAKSNTEGSSSTYQIKYWNALWRVPQCQNLFKTLFFFCNGMIFPSHQTTVLRRSHNNNPSWDMESLVRYNALGHKRAISSIQSQGCFKLFHYHYTL